MAMASLRTSTTMRTVLCAGGSNTLRRHFHQTMKATAATDSYGKPPDKKGEAGNQSPKPKISNLSMPGIDKTKQLTEEQARDVEQHNLDFEKKFDHGQTAPDDKVDKKFWEGSGGARK